jgi:hypothetical protein
MIDIQPGSEEQRSPVFFATKDFFAHSTKAARVVAAGITTRIEGRIRILFTFSISRFFRNLLQLFAHSLR